MHPNKRFTMGLLIAGVIGSMVIDLGPLLSSSHAQGRGQDEGESGNDGRRGRFRGFRDGGGDGNWFRRSDRRGDGADGNGGGPPDREAGPGGGFRGRRFGGEGGSGDSRGSDGGGRRGFRRDRQEAGENAQNEPSGGSRGDQRREEPRAERSSMDTAEYAKSLVKERDKNGNGMLEGDELKDLRGRAASADANNDKVITVDELVARLSDRGGTGPTQNAAGAGSGGGTAGSAKESTGKSTSASKTTRVYTALASPAGSGDKNAASKRRTYRFTPPGERLPANLPSWFKSRDRNNDGQVEMSEYSRTWSERLVNEFRRYDLNDDGVVTPKEAATK